MQCQQGKISWIWAKKYAENEYEKYRVDYIFILTFGKHVDAK